MADFMLVRHKVQDYDVWKPFYDADLPRRNEAGLSEVYLLRDAEEPNDIFILFAAQDIAVAKDFAESDSLREVMERAGVVSKAEVYLLRSAE